MTLQQKKYKLLIMADIRIVDNYLKDKDNEDKSMKLIASYHTQQAIEKTIKLKAEIKGVNLWGHNIKRLLDDCKRYGIINDLDVPLLIVRNANMYTGWEANSRYYPTTTVNVKSIEAAIRECKGWLASGDTI